MGASTNIPIGATTTGFIAAVQAARTAVTGFVSDLNRNLANGFRVADRDSRLFEQGLGRLGNNLKNVGQSLSTYLTLPLAGLAGAGLKAASDMEQAGVSFRVLLKDANLAASTVNDLKVFAASTPFEFTEVQQGAKQLLAYGFAASDLKTILTDAGNLASGFGVQIGEVTRVLGRIKSGDFGEAFERLRDFGIGRDVLEAKGLKFDKSNQYQGSVKQAFDVIQQVIRERFGGQMEEQSKTLGGIFSNIKDQGAFALAELGEKLVSTFNLKEVGKNLVDFMTKLRAGFSNLPEPLQKTVILFGTLAGLAGPLTFGIGSIIRLLPVLVSGISAIASPVTLVVAAVAGAAYLIYKYWDDIKKVVTNSGIWDTVVNLATAGMDTVKAVFSAGVTLLTATWDKLKLTIIPTATFLFETLGAVFKTAAGVLTGIFKTITGALTLDWSTFKEGLQNITASLWNGVVSLFAAGVKLTGTLFANFLESIGAGSFADAAREKLNKIVEGIKGVRVELQNAIRVGKEGISLPEVTVTGKRTVSTGGLATNLSTTNNGDSDAGKEFTKLDTLRRTAASLESQIQSLDQAAPQKLYDQLSAVRREIERIESLTKGSTVNLGNLNSLRPTQSTPEAPKLPGVDSLLERLQAPFKKIKESLQQLNSDINSSLKDAAQSALVGMGEVVGGLIAGTNGVQAIPQLLLGTLGGLMKQLGTIAIQAAIGLTAIRTALKTLNPAVALVAGIGLIALGTAIQSGASKIGSGIKGYAKGGVFTEETLGRFGEYPGASRNPEIATPQSILRATFQQELSRVPFDRLQAGAQAQRSTPKEMYVNLGGLTLRGSDLELSRKRYLAKVSDYNPFG